LKRFVDGIKNSGLKQSLKRFDLTKSEEINEVKEYLKEQGMEHIQVTQKDYD
jgi:hypothetical protein